MLINLYNFVKSEENIYHVDKKITLDDETFVEKNNLLKDIYFTGHFYKTDDMIYLEASIKYAYKEICARCLCGFLNTVESPFKARIVNHFEDMNDLGDSEEFSLLQINDVIDLRDVIKQVIYLFLPMKALCTENCKGLCSVCGANLNIEKCKCNENAIEPRLMELKKLLND